MGFGVSDAGLALPAFVYDHSLGCSVTGKHAYRGLAYHSLQEVYLFGDYCSGRLGDQEKRNALLADTTLSISTFGEDESANVLPVPTALALPVAKNGRHDADPSAIAVPWHGMWRGGGNGCALPFPVRRGSLVPRW